MNITLGTITIGDALFRIKTNFNNTNSLTHLHTYSTWHSTNQQVFATVSPKDDRPDSFFLKPTCVVRLV